jgi:hypothetical protein
MGVYCATEGNVGQQHQGGYMGEFVGDPYIRWQDLGVSCLFHHGY